jgi:NtrC-family two-component system sensor histidine kinase KinB
MEEQTMPTTLRRRVLLVIAPAFLLLALTGGFGAWLLILLGQRSGAILRENYNSVRAMDRLLFALHQIDESHRLTLAGKNEARNINQSAWEEYQKQYTIEENNITIIPKEQELFTKLQQATTEYRQLNEKFFASSERAAVYSKLILVHQQLNSIAQQIHDLNETHMQDASRDAQQTAQRSIVGFSIGLLVSLVALLSALWWLDRTVVVPIRSVRDAAKSIGSGQLHLMVPVHSHDEIGELAQEFNAMTSKLRVYKQSDMEALRRAQQTRQATIDSFPDPIIVLDPAGHVESANPAAQQLFGFTTSAVGQTVEKWNAPESMQGLIEQALVQKQNLESNSFEEVITFRFQNEERAYLPRHVASTRPQENIWGQPSCSAMSLASVCWTSSRPTGSPPSAMN